MASFRCYDNSDVIATLIITNFHLYLIQLWWQFFQMFVYGDVVYAQTWQSLTLKNCIEPLHMPVRPMLLHRMALVFVRLFCKLLGQMPPCKKLPVRLSSNEKPKKMKTPGRHFHIWSTYKGEFLAVPEKWSTHNSMLCELC